ncbi:MAG TPA: PEP/pyruvate-binding domain-containing protein, partial [Anaerolineales bacterium]|nr:PEP/pyruvate-binding domain-containing protein [Anaerolineales bacterium]
MPVPLGFCVTTQAFRRFPEALDDESFRKKLSESLNGLLQAEGIHRFAIVRSSANLEDSFQAAFPGVFISSGPLNSLGSLITALEQCFLAIQNDQVRKYCQHKGIKAKSIRMSALVQQYIEPDYSGVAILQMPQAKLRGAHVEMTRGASNKILRGTENVMAFLVRKREPK